MSLKTNLGAVTAYADAVAAGYTGTREQWAEDMAKLGENVAEVREAVTAANTAKDGAETARDETNQLAENAVAAINEAADARIEEIKQAGGTSTDVGAVRFDEAQTLTAEQQGQARTNVGAVGIDEIPSFEMSGIEYNEITKATEVSTFEELKNYNGNAILKNYRHESVSKGAVANTDYDILKIPAQPGDIIRDKLATWWKSPANPSGWMYAYFYNNENACISNFSIYYDGNANSNYLDIRENGYTVPDSCAYVLINILRIYRLLSGTDVNNGKTANVITKNADANLTAYDGVEVLPDYTPVESYYISKDDLRITRYEDALGDIEKILAEVVGGVE